ncbi:MAG TPA: carboxylesterase family protein, partial [Vicinamibacterales bacterium]|nr:carboxylesterase family protein [Vicinamibacterales bacterium]
MIRRVAMASGLILFVAATASAALPGAIKIDTGLVSGVTGTAAASVTAFKGIPFAAPPVGQNRWRDPQPAARWQGVRKADAFGNRCISGVGFGG